MIDISLEIIQAIKQMQLKKFLTITRSVNLSLLIRLLIYYMTETIMKACRLIYTAVEIKN